MRKIDEFVGWFHNSAILDLIRKKSMPVTLSIKNVPDHLANCLRVRANQHHRSLQGELMAILENTLIPTKKLSASEFMGKVRELGITTNDDSVAMIRADRDDH